MFIFSPRQGKLRMFKIQLTKHGSYNEAVQYFNMCIDKMAVMPIIIFLKSMVPQSSMDLGSCADLIIEPMMASHSECRTAGFHPVWPPMCEQRSYRLVVWCYWSMNGDSLKWKTYSELANKIFTLWCNQCNEHAIRIHSHFFNLILGLMARHIPMKVISMCFMVLDILLNV